MREPTRQCGVENCPKGGTHREPYLATTCRLYHRYYNQGKRKLINTIRQMGKEPSPLLETTSLLGTSQGWKKLAKELKIRCYSRMTGAELQEAIGCIKGGNQDRLKELEQAARERTQAAWNA